jgi:hypothetical protein
LEHSSPYLGQLKSKDAGLKPGATLKPRAKPQSPKAIRAD